MEIKARKIGNSVGAIFPKDISPEIGETFTILKVEDTYILKPKKKDIFSDPKDWQGFRKSISSDDREWDNMESEGEES